MTVSTMICRFWSVVGCLSILSGWLCLSSESSASASPIWEVLATDQVSIQLGVALRSRRSVDATMDVSLRNGSNSLLAGPLRLVITDLTPADKVAIANASGLTENGEVYFDLTGYLGSDFAAGGSGKVTVVVKGGGPTIFSFRAHVERQAMPRSALTIRITEPMTLQTVGHTPQTIKGVVSDPLASITLNGAPVANLNGQFQADVTLDEGHNTVSARAVNGNGEDVSDVIALSLDMTPPYLTVASPKAGQVLRTSSIAVSGLINDIVRGTVADGQAHVKVNGVAAAVSNRSYLAENIALNEGENLINIDASDQVGNTSHIGLKVRYQPLAPQHIELVSGQDQTSTINTAIAQALSVKLLDAQHRPMANKPVIYRVIEGDGRVGSLGVDQGQGVLAMTDSQGVASTRFVLGSRAGVGNQRVRATAVGFDGEVLFYASATVGSPNKVTVNSGNNQRGATGQPLAKPFVVAVVDEGANLMAGARVEFKVTQGNGHFQNGQTQIIGVTDSDGRATAELTLGDQVGWDIHRVTARLVDSDHFVGFTASALKPGPPGQTSISGVVLDNQDHPLPRVTMRVEGSQREAQTDEQGQFKITETPVGALRLIADGSTSTVEGEYPSLAFDVFTISGADNPLPAPIYLVKLDTLHAQHVGEHDVTLTLPDVPGFALDVKAGSVTFPDGNKSGQLSVTPVNASKIPMPPPNGMQPRFIVTIQPVGARFDPPARLSLPNADGHKPGAQVEMYSYDHDLEEFVAIGLGTVSVDGSVIQSNEGVGVIKAGWHCGSQPGGSGCAASPGECQKCEGNCQIGNDDSKKPISIFDSKGDCKKTACKNGLPTQVVDLSDLPDPAQSADNACKTCDGLGNLIADISKDGLECDSQDSAKFCNKGICERIVLDIERPSLNKTVSIGKPKNGNNVFFKYSTNLLNGFNGMSYVTKDPALNPSEGLIGTSTNNGSPIPGGLVEFDVEYHVNEFVSKKSFKGVNFGLSCYKLALENDNINENGDCGSIRIAGITYDGNAVNPQGLPKGSYCNAFLADVRLQGSGTTVGGLKVHYEGGSYPNWIFSVVNSFTGSDNTPLIPFGSCARDKTIVPRNTTVNLESYSLEANDTGGAILGYRIDVFGGSGRQACNNFKNIMSIGACSPSSEFCPGLISPIP